MKLGTILRADLSFWTSIPSGMMVAFYTGTPPVDTSGAPTGDALGSFFFEFDTDPYVAPENINDRLAVARQRLVRSVRPGNRAEQIYATYSPEVAGQYYTPQHPALRDAEIAAYRASCKSGLIGYAVTEQAFGDPKFNIIMTVGTVMGEGDIIVESLAVESGEINVVSAVFYAPES